MKFGTRILVCMFFVFGIGFYYMTHGILENIRSRYLESVEESLVDQARILASFISNEMEKKSFSPQNLHMIFDRTYNRSFSARIYQINKTSVDLRVYITDKKGGLLFDSSRREKKGTDYSNWRDVSLTLKGKYGARASRENPDEQESTILYVAAPVFVNGDIAGSLTVAKPTTNINNFLKFERYRIIKRSIITVVLVIVFCILVISYLTRPIKHLTKYANDIKNGKKAMLPELDRYEIGEMGRAFENMREALEGKKYVEKYVQTLTHEIKSPVSAIQGAAELLEEEMAAAQRMRFLSNIQNESKRIQRLVERMLALASIENLKTLRKSIKIDFNDLVDSILERMRPVLKTNKLKVETQFSEGPLLYGDPFLLKQAISNIIQNAIDFSPENTPIVVSTKISGDMLNFIVTDNGPGIPEFAVSKIFDKFFSLQRPGNSKKSTGLGLNFVKEIASLHKGEMRLENRSGTGARATLILPLDNL